MIKFTYYGEIKGKGRPRFRNTGKFIQTYTDSKTRDYEMSLKEAYLQANQESYMNPETPLELTLVVYQEIPKSTSKKKAKEMLDGYIRPTKKPDADNIIKSVLDSLNKVAFYDDTQFIAIHVWKYYDIKPCLKVRIEEFKKEDLEL